jgi:hypothetical protein
MELGTDFSATDESGFYVMVIAMAILGLATLFRRSGRKPK